MLKDTRLDMCTFVSAILLQDKNVIKYNIKYPELNKRKNALNSVKMFTYQRELLLIFLEILKIIHKNKWAKSSIEIIWEYSQTFRCKFIPGQQQKRLDDLCTHSKISQIMKMKRKHKTYKDT